MSLNPSYRNYVAGADLTRFRIAKYDTTAGQVVLASAATDAFAGVIAELSPLSGQRVDIAKAGIAPVEAGAAFAQGAPLTSDAQGRAIAAAPATGANVRFIGFAEEAATAAGDIVNYLAAPGFVQG